MPQEPEYTGVQKLGTQKPGTQKSRAQKVAAPVRRGD
jgi:hypothetical protein